MFHSEYDGAPLKSYANEVCNEFATEMGTVTREQGTAVLGLGPGTLRFSGHSCIVFELRGCAVKA